MSYMLDSVILSSVCLYLVPLAESLVYNIMWFCIVFLFLQGLWAQGSRTISLISRVQHGGISGSESYIWQFVTPRPDTRYVPKSLKVLGSSSVKRVKLYLTHYFFWKKGSNPWKVFMLRSGIYLAFHKYWLLLSR